MTRRVLFDITRLAWRARRSSPTGIDRVLTAYGEWLLGHPELTVVPVALAGDRLVEIPMRVFTRMMDRTRPATSAGAERGGDWRRLQDILRTPSSATRAIRRPIVATPPSDWAPLALDIASRFLRLLMPAPVGDLYLNVSHTGLHRQRLLAGLVERGIAPVVMVHDLIPITHPEYCADGAGARHALRVDGVLAHAALVIANSGGTAAALQTYAARTGQRLPQTQVAWLGIEPAFIDPGEPPALPPYFVCVGTIEARKNLAFILTLWRRLADQLGPTCPHLVLVGRRGWENESVLDHLERSPAIERLVHEVADLSDAQLAALLHGARALLAPSLVEGFDLPPIEALSMGTPVIASDIDVHRELALGAQLVDPLDGPGWIAAIAAATTTPPPRPRLTPPTWAAHFSIVEAALTNVAARA